MWSLSEALCAGWGNYSRPDSFDEPLAQAGSEDSENQVDAIKSSPNNVGPVGSVPQTADKESDKEIEIQAVMLKRGFRQVKYTGNRGTTWTGKYASVSRIRQSIWKNTGDRN